MHEINLLPPLRRLTLRREVVINSLQYILSSVVYACLAVTLTAGATWALLGASTWRLSATDQSQIGSAISEYQQLRDEIAEHNALLEYVQSLSNNRLTWTDFIADFLATIPPGVEIGGMTGSAVMQGTMPQEVIFTFNGQAAARGGLTLFADRLRLLKGVTQVVAPNSNLIKRENPLYQFTIHLDPSVRDQKP